MSGNLVSSLASLAFVKIIILLCNEQRGLCGHSEKEQTGGLGISCEVDVI